MQKIFLINETNKKQSMSFPTINFKKNNVEIADSLLYMMEEKFASLEKFVGDWPSNCDAEFTKIAENQQGNIHRVEVNLSINGRRYYASATENNFEKAIDEVRNELDKQLSRSNSKNETLIKRGGRKIKEMLRWGR